MDALGDRLALREGDGGEDDRFLSAPTASISNPLEGQPTGSAPIDAGVADVVSAVLGEGPGSQIGPYKLLELIGEGGFGSVFMAEQRSPVVRKVALKIIKLGMDTRQVIARFEAERQALAMMDHPSIARIFDAGSTETGRPFFVMELVKGDPIVKYCDRNNLGIHDRLELFSQVCKAVQHAHTKGIIHRDIKPSNILVSTQDGRPQIKVIDFGIAKATASKLTERTLFTEHRQLIGTPEYMSPEQAEGSLDIDTRTDVYSLGVLLYELLIGTTPFSWEDLRSAAFGEIQRIIREVDPPSPSTRLSRSGDSLASIAASRRSEPRKLGAMIRGELDWIVMKALEKDRARRYGAASNLAADIERYLSGEAVLAAPPSTTYRLRKFVQRNRAVVSAAGAVAVALLVGVVAFAWQARVARGQRDRAVLAEAESAQRADDLQLVSDIQAQMLAQVDAAAAGLRLTIDVRQRLEEALVAADVPEADRGVISASFADDWARLNATDIALQLIDSAILTPALAEIDRQLVDRPVIQANLRGAVVEQYDSLGLTESAWEASQKLVEILRSSVGENHPDTISALIAQYRLLGFHGGYAEAEMKLRELLSAHRERLGADHPLMLTAASQVGVTLIEQGKYSDAEAILREVLERRRKVFGEDHRLTLLSIANVASVLREQGKYEAAEPLEREALEARRRLLGNDHADTIESLRNYATLLLAQGRLAEAEESGALAVESARRVLGDLHPSTITIVGNLASMMSRNGKTEQAELLQREVLRQTEAVLGRDHPSTITAVNNLATYLMQLRRFEEDEPLCRRSLDACLRVLGRNHPNTHLVQCDELPDAASESPGRSTRLPARSLWCQQCRSG
jgi:serine/threonine protein kinase/tetratricopeptide (TPR) repeat protein